MTELPGGAVTEDQSPAPRAGLSAQLTEPVRRFMRTDSGRAGLLLLATLAALAWANSPWGGTYQAVWSTELSVGLADTELALDLRHWVNDGLMVFFFFVVGLEVRRELVMGELTDPKRAAVPLTAAATGLAVPALL